eukprot:1146292-Pelagomonas_calceolata.AAC.3
MACDPVNLSQYADLISRHLGYWNQFTAPNPRVNNSKWLTYHQWYALPVRKAHAMHPPYTTPKYMYLDLPHYVLRNTARFRLRAIWSNSISPVCDICDSHDIQDEKCVLLRCSKPQEDEDRMRSALSVKSMPHFLSTTSLFYIFMSPTGCPV